MAAKEFEDYFFLKGMPRQCGRDEWQRRRNDPTGRWRADEDPDCKLPRVQAFGATKIMEARATFTMDTVDLSTQGVRNPKKRQIDSLLEGLQARPRPS